MTAAERGDCYRHVARATCETRACKSFIAVGIHFLLVALGLDATHEMNVWKEGVLPGCVLLRTCTAIAASLKGEQYGRYVEDDMPQCIIAKLTAPWTLQYTT